MKRLLFASALTACAALGLSAQTSVAQPKVHAFKNPNGAFIQNISDNGRYAVLCGWLEENNLYYDFPVLIDLTDDSEIDLREQFQKTEENGEVYYSYTSLGAFDVADNGLVVGTVGTTGAYENPGYWKPSTQKWARAKMPAGSWQGGRIHAVSADGTIGVGCVYNEDQMVQSPVAWNLNNGAVIALDNLPYYNRIGEPAQAVQFTNISADGRYIFGKVDWFISDEINGEWGYSFVYDMDEETWEALGYITVDGIPQIDAVKGVGFSSESYASPSGRYVLGHAYGTDDEDASAALYDVENKTYKVLPGEKATGALLNYVNNEGTPFCATPAEVPLRDWSVLADGFWVSAEQMYQQIWGKTSEALTGIADATSGTIMCMDASGRVIGSMIYPQGGESYVIEFPEDPAVLAKDIDLLYSYTVTPASDSEFSSISGITVIFDREVEVSGASNDIKLVKADDDSVVRSSSQFAVSVSDPTTVNITFRKTALQAGVNYKVVIPAGSINAKGDASKSNREITFNYKGRDAVPVYFTDVQPASGTKIAQFNSSTNPIILTLDTKVKIADSPAGRLQEIDAEGNVIDDLCNIGFLAAGNQVLIYPLLNQNLYKGSLFRVTVDANSIVDIQGENPNEALVLEYEGVYERPFNADSKYLFYEDFNSTSWVNNLIRWDADNLTPNDFMVDLGFLNGNDYPWWWVRNNDEATTASIASHSMYAKGGQSDDWMIIPQLFLKDERITLKFKALRYYEELEDELQIKILVANEVYNHGSDELIEKIDEEGIEIFNEVLEPAPNGDFAPENFKEYAISLADFAGKNVYICFHNQNKDKGIVIVDDIAVELGLDFIISPDTETQVINATSVPIQARVRVENPSETYNALTATLMDANKNVIETKELTGLDLKYGDSYSFAFDNEFPLTKGTSNVYYINVTSGDSSADVQGTIDNLLFKPHKRVLLEEVTGQHCPNCPLGHAAIDLLHDNFGDDVIVVAHHTYTGDNFASGMGDYTTYYLQATAFPNAVIERSGIYPPMAISDGKAVYTDGMGTYWWDAVTNFLEAGAIADIEYGSDDSGIEGPYFHPNRDLVIPVEVTFALDKEDLNLTLLHFITEDNLSGVQANAQSIYNCEDPILGEWGKGGVYGRAMNKYTFDHVTRGLIGATYIGTPGLFPETAKANEVLKSLEYKALPSYVSVPDNTNIVSVLFDGNTGKVINSVSAKLSGSTSVQEVLGQVAAIKAYTTANGVMIETGSDFKAVAYALDGTALGIATGNGSKELYTGSYRGLVIVKVTTPAGVKTFKLIK